MTHIEKIIRSIDVAIFAGISTILKKEDCIALKQYIAKLKAERAEWRADAERLATENAELHEQLRWRSVTEEPETGQWVFVSRGRNRFADIFIYDRKLSDSFMRYDLWLPIPPQQFGYFPDCPITLHRQLVAKYGGENNQANVFNSGEK